MGCGSTQRADIDWLLSWSPCAGVEACEEWAIHAYRNFANIKIDENPNLSRVTAIARVLWQTESDNYDALAAWIDYASDKISDPDIEGIVQQFDCYYCGHYDSEQDFAENSEEVAASHGYDELEAQFPFWSTFIDWQHVASELFLTEYESMKAKPHGIHVFRRFS
jgi:antirestriction protein